MEQRTSLKMINLTRCTLLLAHTRVKLYDKNVAFILVDTRKPVDALMQPPQDANILPILIPYSYIAHHTSTIMWTVHGQPHTTHCIIFIGVPSTETTLLESPELYD
eukprot:GHVR01046673.1.p1 GENE.GHVR01046673.1~~GHVR01046673.1.p1  ORF type:complete len:106 (+),score=1.91 GHVR01046673.1:127-444(+)